MHGKAHAGFYRDDEKEQDPEERIVKAVNSVSHLLFGYDRDMVKARCKGCEKEAEQFDAIEHHESCPVKKLLDAQTELEARKE